MRAPRAVNSEAPSTLDEERIEELIALVKDASAKTYSPYNKFRVGAAALKVAFGMVGLCCDINYPQRKASVRSSFSAQECTKSSTAVLSPRLLACRVVIQFGQSASIAFREFLGPRP